MIFETLTDFGSLPHLLGSNYFQGILYSIEYFSYFDTEVNITHPNDSCILDVTQTDNLCYSKCGSFEPNCLGCKLTTNLCHELSCSVVIGYGLKADTNILSLNIDYQSEIEEYC